MPHRAFRCIPNSDVIRMLPGSINASCKFISTSSHLWRKRPKADETQKLMAEIEMRKARAKERRAMEASPYITLLDQKGETSVLQLDEATRLARRRNLKLVEHDSGSTGGEKARPTYRLISNAEYLEGEDDFVQPTKRKEKGHKQFSVSHAITSAHLSVKLRSVHKCLEAGRQAKLVIQGRDGTAPLQEAILKQILSEIKARNCTASEAQKVGNNWKFDVNPPKKGKKKSGDGVRPSAEVDRGEDDS